FGRKSEKLLVDNPHQDSLFERSDATTPESQGKQLISYTRSTKSALVMKSMIPACDLMTLYLLRSLKF
ncbi:hypothetical protein, partial [Shewanella sairae]|uniref:hypothetical protein n=1 Tax=Shewanella sairae TaxID=190310 RepID=UPI001C81A6F0